MAEIDVLNVDISLDPLSALPFSSLVRMVLIEEILMGIKLSRVLALRPNKAKSTFLSLENFNLTLSHHQPSIAYATGTSKTMPPRLSKRQQREQEEIAALAARQVESTSLETPASKRPATIDDAEESSTEEAPSKVAPSKPAGFSLNKKKKKKPSAAATPSGTTVASTADATSTPITGQKVGGNTPKKGDKTTGSGKGKGKGKPVDDLDQALAELSSKYSDITIPDPSMSQPSAPALVSALQSLRSSLSVQSKHLDPDAEMRRFFGSKVINAAENSSSASTPPGYQQPRGPVSRSTLCKPQKTWPPGGSRDGLSMRPLTSEEMKLTTGGNTKDNQANNWMLMPGDKWFTLEHSPAYRWDQLRFIQAVGMLDPNNLFSLMRESYWHADTLLQIAEVYRAQDDFTSRALFAYEKSFTGAFNLTSGASRLDFRKIETRYLEKRGTMRTAFEFARLMWALDPWTDPEGALMHLDFLAIKTEQYDWFLEVEELWEEIRKERPFLLPLMERPGWRWSKALILRGLGPKKGGGEAKATEELKRAIIEFPEVLITLAPLVGLTVPIRETRHTQPSAFWRKSMHTALSLYGRFLRTLHGSAQPWSRLHLRLSVARHATVSDLKPLGPFIGSLTAAVGTQEPYDIFPPQGEGVTTYDEQYFSTA
ncbi:12115_t:CDS:10, partial [Acaulospora colombiana]